MPNEKPPELKRILDEKTFEYFTAEMALKPEFYQVVGLFITNFGHAETQLDAVLGEIRGMSNYEDVRDDIKRMTLYKKGEAILLEGKDRLGEAFTQRMKFFHHNVRLVRNDLAHGMLASQESDIIVGHIGAIWDNLDEERWPNSEMPPRRDYKTILGMASWLRNFQDDAEAVALQLREQPVRTADLKDPKSAAPSVI